MAIVAKTKKEYMELLRKHLRENDAWAVRGLVAIYRKQTSDEQQDGVTKELNGVGFSGVDSEILSSLAKQYEFRKSLSPKQMDLVKKLMPRYASQLFRQSIESGRVKKIDGFWQNSK